MTRLRKLLAVTLAVVALMAAAPAAAHHPLPDSTYYKVLDLGYYGYVSTHSQSNDYVVQEADCVWLRLQARAWGSGTVNMNEDITMIEATAISDGEEIRKWAGDGQFNGVADKIPVPGNTGWHNLVQKKLHPKFRPPPWTPLEQYDIDYQTGIVNVQGYVYKAKVRLRVTEASC